MAITVTMPSEAPTGITATPQAGGSLKPNTTYYYVMASFPIQYTTCGNSSRFGYHSPISAEGSFTTTTTDLSVLFKWNIPTGGAYYDVFLSETSGDYTASKSTSPNGEALDAAFNNAASTAGYLVSAEPIGTSMRHSVQMVNELRGGLSKEAGTVKVYLNSDSTLDLDDVYDAVVAAGYSDNVYYDGYTFVLKGWLVADGSSGTGSLVVTKKNLIFVKGGVHTTSTGFSIRFGVWTSDIIGANYHSGCKIDVQHTRYPFRSYGGIFELYGCEVTSIHGVDTRLPENTAVYYYNGGYSHFMTGTLTNVKDSILGFTFRGVSSYLYDIKFGQGNNFGNYPHIRCRVTGYANQPYYAGGKFYATKFLSTAAFRAYQRGTYKDAGHYCDYYDCEFPWADGEINVGNIYYSMDDLYADRFERVNNSITMTVLDVDGVAMEGVTVSAVDKDNNPITWVEHDGTYDKEVTGNEYTTDRTTDVNGEVDYYTEAYRMWMDTQTEIISSNYNLTKTVKYPFTITFSKEGYRDYSILIERMNAPVVGVVTLEQQELTPLQFTNIKIT